MSANGETFQSYADKGRQLQDFHQNLNDPEYYLVEDDLRQAINVALMLGQPLLVTGEPGTGKTHLAKRIAYELKLSTKYFPLIFNTKSTSTARDLFYQYDALRHFHDAQFDKLGGKENLSAEPYITYEALGKAILLTRSPEDAQRRRVNSSLPPELQKAGPLRPVVLIDEIDKAPRDLPNDVLNEIESMSFTVKEVLDEDNNPGLTFTAEDAYRPIIIITSNSERDLPDAFLRRCVFYHIEFPGLEILKQIVRRRLKIEGMSPVTRERLITLFLEIRKLNLKKDPATAELLSWIRVFDKEGIDISDPAQSQKVLHTYTTLAKSADDLKTIREASDKLIKEVLRKAESTTVGR